MSGGARGGRGGRGRGGGRGRKGAGVGNPRDRPAGVVGSGRKCGRRRRARRRGAASAPRAGLRADAPIFVPRGHAKSYANVARVRGDGEEDGDARTDTLPGFEKLSFNHKEAGKLMVKAKAVPVVEVDTGRVVDDVARGFCEEVFAQAVGNVARGEERRARMEKLARLRDRWKVHCEEFDKIAPSLERAREKRREEIKLVRRETRERFDRTIQQHLLAAEQPQPVKEHSSVVPIDLLRVCSVGDMDQLLSWANEHENKLQDIKARINNVDGIDSPLSVAIDNQQREIISVLLDWGAYVDHKRYRSNNGRRQSALHHACVLGDVVIAQILIDHGGFETSSHVEGLINSKDIKGRTALHIACMGERNGENHQGHVECVNLLLERGASNTIKDKEGNTCVHFAALSGNADILNLFLRSSSSSVHTRNRKGETALHIAAFRGNTRIVAELIRAGAKIDVVENTHLTPLCQAVWNNKTETVRVLIERGAKVKVSSQGDESGAGPDASFCPCAINLAASLGHVDVLDTIIQTSSELSLGFDVNTKDDLWPCDTVLMSALRNAHWECAKHLIRSYSPDVSVLNKKGHTPLFVALSASKKSALPTALFQQLISKNGLNLLEEHPSRRKISAVMVAMDTVLFLQRNGDMALERQALSIVQTLIRSGAAVHVGFYQLASKYIMSKCKAKIADWHGEENNCEYTPTNLQARESHPCSLRKENPISLKINFDPTYIRDMACMKDKVAEYADVSLKVGAGEVLCVHQIVIVARCPFFEGMFREGFREANTLDVDMSNHGDTISRQVIEYLYTGKIEHITRLQKEHLETFHQGLFVMETVQNLVDLLIAANEFLLPRLEDFCAAYMTFLIQKHFEAVKEYGKQKTSLRKTHIKDLLQFANDMGQCELGGMCQRILSAMRTGLFTRCTVHGVECKCTSKLLDAYGLRFCRSETVTNGVIDVSKLLAWVGVQSEEFQLMNPLQLGSLIKTYGDKFITLDSGHMLISPNLTEFIARTWECFLQSEIPRIVGVELFALAKEMRKPLLQTWEGERGCTDIELCLSDGTSLFAHKAVLCCRSTWFNKNIQQDSSVFCLPGSYSQKAWKQLLYFLYTGTLPEKLLPFNSATETLELTELSSLLDLPQVCSLLEVVFDPGETSDRTLVLEEALSAPILEILFSSGQSNRRIPACLWRVENAYRQYLLHVDYLPRVPAVIKQLVHHEQQSKGLTDSQVCILVSLLDF